MQKMTTKQRALVEEFIADQQTNRPGTRFRMEAIMNNIIKNNGEFVPELCW